MSYPYDGLGGLMNSLLGSVASDYRLGMLGAQAASYQSSVADLRRQYEAMMGRRYDPIPESCIPKLPLNIQDAIMRGWQKMQLEYECERLKLLF